MTKRAKTVKGLLILLLTLTSLLVAVILIAPRIISHTAVTDKVRSEVARMINGEFDFKQLELSFFPWPKVVLDDLKLNVPQQLSVSIKAIKIYPEILPLLSGNFILKKAIIQRPEARILMTKSIPKNMPLSSPPATGQSTFSISKTLDELAIPNFPITRGIVTQGSIELIFDNNTSFKLKGVEADLQKTLKDVTFQIRAASDMFNVSGNFMVSDQKPRLRSQLEVQNLDIHSARSTALAAAGGNRAIQTLFDILTNGTIPLVTISSQANRIADLGNWDSFSVQGKLLDGSVKIPGTELEMTAVKGDIKLLKGTLEGENIQARWGNSSIQNGTYQNSTLKLDLTHPPLPLKFETGITADMADIPAILDRIVQDQDIKKELSQLQDFQGSARGKLLLAGDTDHLKIKVSATDIKLSGQYHKIPYPLSLNNGSISYDGNQIGWEQLAGSIGTSSFSAFSGSLDLGGANDFIITSGISRILLPELVPWVSSHENARKFSEYWGGGKSILQLSKVLFKGRLQDFNTWHFDIAGDLEDVVFHNLPGHLGPLKILSLNFTADPETLEYYHGQTRLLDTSLEISGIHQHYLTDFTKDVKWTFDGKMGPQTSDWLSQTIDMPAWLKLNPLSFAPSHLAYSDQGGHKLAATLSFQDGLEVSTEFTVTANETIVQKLTIKDQSSQASLAGSFTDPSINLSFDGNLHESTLEQLFAVSPPFTSSIDGKAQIRLNRKNPYDMSFDGNLIGKNLYLPLGMKTPVAINHIALNGTPKQIQIKSANLFWNDMDLVLSGNITPNASKSVAFDLDIAADTIDVEKIMGGLGEREKSLDEKPSTPALFVPIKGDIRFKARQLKTEMFTIQPLSADIRVQDTDVDIRFKEIELCGIPASGTLKISQQGFEYRLEPAVKAQTLNTTLHCFIDNFSKADGTFDAAGIIEGHGTADNLLKSSSGYMDLSISDGHIYQDLVLLKVVKFLNAKKSLTDILTEDQLKKEGFSFKRWRTQVKLQDGKLKYENFLLDGNQLTIIGEGEIDIIQKQLDFTLLVAPHKTTTTLLGYIPLVGGALQTMTAIPLRVKGPLENFQVLPLAPSAIKYELKEIMKETLGAPMKLIPIKE